MKHSVSRNVFAVAFVALALIFASVCFVIMTDASYALYTAFADFIVLGTVAIVCMAISLKKSLAETIYSFTNIGLIAGILFVFVLTVVMVASFIACIVSGNISLDYIATLILAFPGKFSFYALFAIIALCAVVGVSNVELIRKEGFRVHNALSIVLALFYILLALGAYYLSGLVEKLGDTDSIVLTAIGTAIPTFLLLMLSYFECILVGTIVMGYVAARQRPKYDKDFIIILGCSISKDGGLLPVLKGRVNRAVRFAWEQEIETGKPMKFVPTGGKGTDEVMSEGSAMELYLLTKGAERDEVYPEKQAFDTAENFKFSKVIIDKLNPTAKIAFATTNYHMLRSGILARMAGIDAEGIAGDTKWYFWPNGFVREFFALIAMKMKAHGIVAAFIGAMCVIIGFISAYAGLI